MLGQHEIECDGEAFTYWLYDDFVFRHPFFAVCHIASVASTHSYLKLYFNQLFTC